MVINKSEIWFLFLSLVCYNQYMRVDIDKRIEEKFNNSFTSNFLQKIYLLR